VGEAAALVSTAVEDGDLVTIFGRCTVEYDGRAASDLPPGDRHVMIKPDGTTLVHSTTGQQPVNWMQSPADISISTSGQSPVNWQPPGYTHEMSVDDGRLRLRSERSTPAEELVVTFESVQQVSAFDARDEEELALTGTEEDLRERILANPDLVEAGFTPLATERETSAGAVDIFGEDRDDRTIVLELKRRRVGPDAVGQLVRYVEALRRELHTDAEVRGILVAPSVTDRARELLGEESLEFVSLMPGGESA
jgi:RecB family endonuclease NucS